MGTYTPPEPANHSVFFQDCEISPATLADGSLRQRLDTLLYPRRGVTGTAVVGAASITLSVSPAHPAHTDDVTITVTVVSGIEDMKPKSTVDILNNGTNLHTGLTLDANGSASWAAGKLTAGAYSLTAKYAGDNEVPRLVSQAYALTVS